MGSKRNRCRICGKTFKTAYALKQHLKSSHPRYYYGTRIGIPCAIVAIVILASLFLVYIIPHQPIQTTATKITSPTKTSIIQTTSTAITPPTMSTQTIQRTEKVCMVYFTFIGCPNCAVTDPIVLSEWPVKYRNFVIIEYVWRGGDIAHPNARTLGKYADIYHTHAVVPQIILSEKKIWRGRDNVRKAEKPLSILEANPCPLISDSKPISKPFEEIKLQKLPGLPKIWANGRILISLGNDSWIFGWNGTHVMAGDVGDKIMDDSHLKQLLFVDDIRGWLRGYKFEVLEGVKALFSGSAFPPSSGYVPSAYFENAVKIPVKASDPPSDDPKNSPVNLLLLTVTIAGMDSLNPCAFYILTFLLSILIYARSKKKILIVGGVFVITSGICYFLFMTAWLNIFLIAGQITILIWIVMGFAILAGILNIKDYLYPKPIEASRGRLAKIGASMRELLRKGSTFALILGSFALAFTVNIYELICTVGFPIIYTEILSSYNLPMIIHILYLILYNVIYIIPLAAIVLAFAFALGGRRLTEYQARVLKLVSGWLILILALTVLLNPVMLEHPLTSLQVLLIALGASALTMALEKGVRKWIYVRSGRSSLKAD